MKRKLVIVLVVFLSILSVSKVSYALEHSGSITQDETWSTEDNPHIVTSVIVLQNATLTIDPGVEVLFDTSSLGRLTIGGSTPGRLIAIGTDTDKIAFRPDDPQSGRWGGIFFNSEAADDSVLENAILEYGGRSGVPTITITESNPSIRNCTVRYGYGGGIELDTSAAEISNCVIEDNRSQGMEWRDFSGVVDGNLIARNGGCPIRIQISNSEPPVINVPNTFVSNNPNRICFLSDIRDDYTLINFGIPYLLTDHLVSDNATLTIDPGVEVLFDTSSLGRLTIGGSTPGRLIAIGTDTDKIAFRPDDPQSGRWGGIFFNSEAADDSVLENAILEYGGRSGVPTITITESNPSIRNCTVRYGYGNGIKLNNSSAEITCSSILYNQIGIYTTSSTPTISQNNFNGNVNWAVYNASSTPINATDNWWGDVSGPSGVGPGTGDAVSQNVLYDPWLTATSACSLPIYADFSATPTDGAEALTVQFTDRSTSPEGVTAWQWDLDGDGLVDSIQENPIFTYFEPGLYTITLTVYEADGDFSSEMKSDYVTVTESLPIADFNGTPLTGTAPMTVTFTDFSSSFGTDTIVSWDWDMNDDSVVDITEQNPTWEYHQQGSYTVTLKVTDEDGDTDTSVKENYIVVGEPTYSVDVELERLRVPKKARTCGKDKKIVIRLRNNGDLDEVGDVFLYKNGVSVYNWPNQAIPLSKGGRTVLEYIYDPVDDGGTTVNWRAEVVCQDDQVLSNNSKFATTDVFDCTH